MFSSSPPPPAPWRAGRRERALLSAGLPTTPAVAGCCVPPGPSAPIPSRAMRRTYSGLFATWMSEISPIG